MEGRKQEKRRNDQNYKERKCCQMSQFIVIIISVTLPILVTMFKNKNKLFFSSNFYSKFQ